MRHDTKIRKCLSALDCPLYCQNDLNDDTVLRAPCTRIQELARLGLKILVILPSHDQLGDTGRKTGFWLEELAAPYYVFMGRRHQDDTHPRPQERRSGFTKRSDVAFQDSDSTASGKSRGHCFARNFPKLISYRRCGGQAGMREASHRYVDETRR